MLRTEHQVGKLKRYNADVRSYMLAIACVDSERFCVHMLKSVFPFGVQSLMSPKGANVHFGAGSISLCTKKMLCWEGVGSSVFCVPSSKDGIQR